MIFQSLFEPDRYQQEESYQENTVALSEEEYLEKWYNCTVTYEEWIEFPNVDFWAKLKDRIVNIEKRTSIENHQKLLYRQLVGYFVNMNIPPIDDHIKLHKSLARIDSIVNNEKPDIYPNIDEYKIDLDFDIPANTYEIYQLIINGHRPSISNLDIHSNECWGVAHFFYFLRLKVHDALHNMMKKYLDVSRDFFKALEYYSIVVKLAEKTVIDNFNVSKQTITCEFYYYMVRNAFNSVVDSLESEILLVNITDRAKFLGLKYKAVEKIVVMSLPNDLAKEKLTSMNTSIEQLFEVTLPTCFHIPDEFPNYLKFSYDELYPYERANPIIYDYRTPVGRYLAGIHYYDIPQESINMYLSFFKLIPNYFHAKLKMLFPDLYIKHVSQNASEQGENNVSVTDIPEKKQKGGRPIIEVKPIENYIQNIPDKNSFLSTLKDACKDLTPTQFGYILLAMSELQYLDLTDKAPAIKAFEKYLGKSFGKMENQYKVMRAPKLDLLSNAKNTIAEILIKSKKK